MRHKRCIENLEKILGDYTISVNMKYFAPNHRLENLMSYVSHLISKYVNLDSINQTI